MNIDLIFYHLIIYLPILILSFFFSKKFNLLDIPSEKRKIHKNPTPYSGGIALIFYYIIVLLINSFENNLEKILIVSILIFFIGILDDKRQIKALIKILLTLIPIILLIFLGLYIDDLGIYEFIGVLILGKYKYIFCVLCVLLIINAVNYIDGIDGLALSQILLSLLYLAFLSENNNTKNFLYLLSLPLIINLFFNFNLISKFKFFLGNSGSLILGFILSFLVIFLYKYENIHPSFLIWSLYFYVYEFLSVNLVRFKDKRSLFKAGNDHIHHAIFLLFKKSHFKTSLILFVVSTIVFISSYFINYYLPKIFSLIFFVISFFIYLFIRNLIFQKSNKLIVLK